MTNCNHTQIEIIHTPIFKRHCMLCGCNSVGSLYGRPGVHLYKRRRFSSGNTLESFELNGHITFGEVIKYIK